MSSAVYILALGLTGTLGQLIRVGKSVARLPYNSTEKACFATLGCFDLGEPWSRLGRVPPPAEPQQDATLLYFYSRKNTEEPYVLTTYPDVNVRGIPFDGKLPTVIIFHGYRQDSTMEWIHTMKYFHLLDMNSNVFHVDFSKACDNGLEQSVSNARVVGRLVARLLKQLISQRGLRPEKIHLIGHGLGAHVASYVAKEIPGISRLTALDPQRPFFEGYDRKIRLDKTDATFVEVVHTNAIPEDKGEGFGMIEPHGHVDFYFNDGGNQPGCLFPPGFPRIASLKDLFTLHTQYHEMMNACNQNRAYDYLVEAYNSLADCQFWGHKEFSPPVAKPHGLLFWKYFLSLLGLDSLQQTELADCTEDECIPFGPETIRSSLRGIFVVDTNTKPPYCMPEPGLPLEK